MLFQQALKATQNFARRKRLLRAKSRFVLFPLLQAECAGQVISDTAIGCLIADCCSKALGGKLPSLECRRTLL